MSGVQFLVGTSSLVSGALLFIAGVYHVVTPAHIATSLATLMPQSHRRLSVGRLIGAGEIVLSFSGSQRSCLAILFS